MEHRILLVEDDRSLADAICAQMKLWALECTCAADFRAVAAASCADGRVASVYERVSLVCGDTKSKLRAGHIHLLGER